MSALRIHFGVTTEVSPFLLQITQIEGSKRYESVLFMAIQAIVQNLSGETKTSPDPRPLILSC